MKLFFVFILFACNNQPDEEEFHSTKVNSQSTQEYLLLSNEPTVSSNLERSIKRDGLAFKMYVYNNWRRSLDDSQEQNLVQGAARNFFLTKVDNAIGLPLKKTKTIDILCYKDGKIAPSETENCDNPPLASEHSSGTISRYGATKPNSYWVGIKRGDSPNLIGWNSATNSSVFITGRDTLPKPVQFNGNESQYYTDLRKFASKIDAKAFSNQDNCLSCHIMPDPWLIDPNVKRAWDKLTIPRKMLRNFETTQYPGIAWTQLDITENKRISIIPKNSNNYCTRCHPIVEPFGFNPPIPVEGQPNPPSIFKMIHDSRRTIPQNPTQQELIRNALYWIWMPPDGDRKHWLSFFYKSGAQVPKERIHNAAQSILGLNFDGYTVTANLDQINDHNEGVANIQDGEKRIVKLPKLHCPSIDINLNSFLNVFTTIRGNKILISSKASRHINIDPKIRLRLNLEYSWPNMNNAITYSYRNKEVYIKPYDLHLFTLDPGPVPMNSINMHLSSAFVRFCEDGNPALVEKHLENMVLTDHKK